MMTALINRVVASEGGKYRAKTEVGHGLPCSAAHEPHATQGFFNVFAVIFNYWATHFFIVVVLSLPVKIVCLCVCVSVSVCLSLFHLSQLGGRAGRAAMVQGRLDPPEDKVQERLA